MIEASKFSNIPSNVVTDIPPHPWEFWDEVSKSKEEFFLISLHRVISYLRILSSQFDEYRHVWEYVSDKVDIDLIKMIRDMRAHADAYAVNKGRFQKEYLSGSKYGLPVNALQTMVINGNILIGGCINANRVYDVINEVFNMINSFEETIMIRLFKALSNESGENV